jgi:putative endonuclease
MNMRASCYILYSQKLNKFYVGDTTNDVSDRIKKHNTAEYGKHRCTATTDD